MICLGLIGVCVLPTQNVYPSEVEFEKHEIATFPDGAQKVETVDLDGDGDIDILSSAQGIRFWENVGDGVFVEHRVADEIGGVISVKAADIDSDGDLDIAAACYDSGSIAWWENDGEQSFVERIVDTSFTGAHDVYVADVNGDGLADIAGARGDPDGSGEIAWWENEGEQSFRRHAVYSGDFSHCVVAEDVDDDGDVDILGTQFDTGFRLWSNDGSEHFTETFYPLSGAHHLIVRDVDQDGLSDILAVGYVARSVTWWKGSGAGAFDAHEITSTFRGVVFVDAADIDGDGDTDILATGESSNVLRWWDNVDNVNFTLRLVAIGLVGASGVSAADLDGDGDMDVVATAWKSTNEVSWWENLSGGTPPCEGDQEGDDISAAKLVDGCSTTGASFDCAGDLDVFRVEAGDPGEYIFETTGPMDTVVRLLDDTGALLQHDDSSGDGANGRVTAQLAQDDVVFIEVAETTSATGSYEFAVPQCGGPEPEFGYVVTAAARVEGSAGTYWASDLMVLNLGDSSARVEVSYWERDESIPAANATLVLSPGELLRQDDVILSLFGVEMGSAALYLSSDQPLVVASRTFNDTGSGTFGQFIAGVSEDDAIAAGETAVLAGITENVDYRTNLGLVNPTETAIELTGALYDSDGVALGVQEFVVPAFGSVQVNRVTSSLTSDPVVGAWMTVASSSGSFFSFLSVVDNRTGDPVYRAGASASVEEVDLCLAGQAKLLGAVGTDWLSDVSILNTGDAAETVTLYLWERGADNNEPLEQELLLDGRQLLAIDDVLLSVFAVTEGLAALNVLGPAGLVAGSRTYNMVDGGTFGQAIPSLVPDHAISAGSSGYLVMVGEDLRFRTNLGLVNIDAGPAEVEVRLFDGAGNQIAGTKSFSLPSRGVTQVNRIVREFTTDDLSSAYLEIRLADASEFGRIHAYGSVVDQTTGDPVFEAASVTTKDENGY